MEIVVVLLAFTIVLISLTSSRKSSLIRKYETLIAAQEKTMNGQQELINEFVIQSELMSEIIDRQKTNISSLEQLSKL